MNNEELKRRAPSIFATVPSERMSSRYEVIRTIDVIESMRKEGYHPVDAVQKGRSMTAKHLVRFRHERDTVIRTETVPEMVLLNAANGTSAYKWHFGLLRAVCLNGLIVADSTLASVVVHHTGKSITERVVQGSHEVLKNAERVQEATERFKAKHLSDDALHAYARDALKLRFEEQRVDDLSHEWVESFVQPQRVEDEGSSLWLAFQRAQERLTRGGFYAEATRRRVRPITDITRNVSLNKKLWELTDRYADA